MKAVLPDEGATEALARRLAAALPERTAGLTLLLRVTWARENPRSRGH